jgi:acetyl esterase/lipase
VSAGSPSASAAAGAGWLPVSSATPPTFLWHTADDEKVFAHNALRFATALADHHVPYELHIFGSGVHGLALADETTAVEGDMINPHAQIWIDLAVRWLRHNAHKSGQVRFNESTRPRSEVAVD